MHMGVRCCGRRERFILSSNDPRQLLREKLPQLPKNENRDSTESSTQYAVRHKTFHLHISPKTRKNPSELKKPSEDFNNPEYLLFFSRSRARFDVTRDSPTFQRNSTQTPPPGAVNQTQTFHFKARYPFSTPRTPSLKFRWDFIRSTLPKSFLSSQPERASKSPSVSVMDE